MRKATKRKRTSPIFRPPCSGIWSSPAPWASRKSGTIGSASAVRCATALMTNGAHDSKSALAITAAIGLFVRHACGFAAAVVASCLLWHNWEVE
jgi:hypothetical protein